MHGRKSYRKRVSDMGVAILLFAGLSQLQPFSPRTVRAGDQREAKPIAPIWSRRSEMRTRKPSAS